VNPTKSVERYLMGFLALNLLMTCLAALRVDSNDVTQQMLIVAVVVTALLLASTLMATRKRKNWALWLITVYIVQGCLSTAYGVYFDESMGRRFMMGYAGTSFLGLMCVFLLFFDDGVKEWFGQSSKKEEQAL